jgi:O-antigen/teichoic acid export membrane protein
MSNHHYFSNLLKKNLWIYFFSFLIAPLAYIGKIAMTGSVSSEDYGVFSAVMSFVIMLGAYNDFGMAESLNFFLPEHIDKKEKHNITQTFSIALVTQILSSSILAIILFFGADFLARYYFEAPLAAPLLHIFILFFFLDNIFRSVSMFFQAVQDTKLQKFIDFIRNLLQIIIIIVISVST